MVGLEGILPDPNEFYRWDSFGCATLPQNPYDFFAISPKSGKLVQAPGPSLWPCLFPLVGSCRITLFGVARLRLCLILLHGTTPLILASMRGHTETTALLLHGRADVNDLF